MHCRLIFGILTILNFKKILRYFLDPSCSLEDFFNMILKKHNVKIWNK